MNRLPVTGFTRLVCGVIFIGWMCEAIDLGITSFMLPTIREVFGMEATVAGSFSSIGFVGMLVGSLFGGPLADRIGRKPVIMVFMIVQGIGGLALALAPTVEFLFAARFVLGLGLGTQFPVAVAYLSESIPSSKRGRYVALFQLFLPIGMAIAALTVAIALEPLGWRWVYGIVVTTVFWVIAVWKLCPESALWLESRGRLEEADKVVTMWEAKARAVLPGGELDPVVHVEQERVSKSSYRDLFKGKQLLYTAVIVICFFLNMQSDYGLTTWLTSLFVSKGLTVTTATWFVGIGILGGIPAFFIASWAVEKIGRKKACALACLITFIFGFLYGLSNTEIMIIVIGFFYNMGKYMIAMTFLVYMPELFETKLRSSGNGLASAGGRLGAILGAIIMAWIFTSFGDVATFGYAATLVLVAGLLVLIFGKETKGKIF